MTRLLALTLPLLGGCDAVFGLSEPRGDAGVVDPDAGDGGTGDDDGGTTLDAGPPLTCFVEDFNQIPLSATWDLYADVGCTGAAGIVPCSASQASGLLAIYVNALMGYAGASRPAVDFTGGAVEVDAVTAGAPLPGTNSYLQIALGGSNGIRYQLEVDAEAGAPLLTGLHISGVDRVEAFSIPFDPQQHRHWQLAQVVDNGAPAIAFATRTSTTEPWTRRGTAPVTEPLSAVIAEVGAGRYAASMSSGAQTYAFDNFRLCTASP